jgi:hypothetical protein
VDQPGSIGDDRLPKENRTKEAGDVYRRDAICYRGGENGNQNGGLGSNLTAGSNPILMEVFISSRA